MQKNLQQHFSTSIEKLSSRYQKHRPDVKEFSIVSQLKNRLGTQLPQISNSKSINLNYKKVQNNQRSLGKNNSKHELSRGYVKALINSNLSNRDNLIQNNLSNKSYGTKNYMIQRIQQYDNSALSRSPHPPSINSKRSIFNSKKKSHSRISVEPQKATTLWPYYEEKQKLFRQSTMASNCEQAVFDSNLETQKQIYSSGFQEVPKKTVTNKTIIKNKYRILSNHIENNSKWTIHTKRKSDSGSSGKMMNCISSNNLNAQIQRLPEPSPIQQQQLMKTLVMPWQMALLGNFGIQQQNRDKETIINSNISYSNKNIERKNYYPPTISNE